MVSESRRRCTGWVQPWLIARPANRRLSRLCDRLVGDRASESIFLQRRDHCELGSQEIGDSRIGLAATRLSTTKFYVQGPSGRWKQVGRELGVRYVLEGSVRRAGGRVRITARLIGAQSGTHLWADRFDRTLEDVFDLQEKGAACIPGARSLSGHSPDSV